MQRTQPRNLQVSKPRRVFLRLNPTSPGFNTNLSHLTVRAGDCLIALGSEEQILSLQKLADGASAG